MIINPIYVKKGDDMPDNSYRVIDRITEEGEKTTRAIFGFLRNTEGYYQAAISQLSQASATCRILFQLKQETEVTFECRQCNVSGEDTDRVWFSKIDVELNSDNPTYNTSSVYAKIITTNNENYTVTIPSGRHFIDTCMFHYGTAQEEYYNFKIASSSVELTELNQEINPRTWNKDITNTNAPSYLTSPSDVRKDKLFIGKDGEVKSGTMPVYSGYTKTITTNKTTTYSTAGYYMADNLKITTNVSTSSGGSTSHSPSLNVTPWSQSPWDFKASCGGSSSTTQSALKIAQDNGDSQVASKIANNQYVFGIKGSYTDIPTDLKATNYDVLNNNKPFIGQNGVKYSTGSIPLLIEPNFKTTSRYFVPSTNNQQYINKPSDLTPSNIIQGADIFGVIGEHVCNSSGSSGSGGNLVWKRIATKPQESRSTQITFQGSNIDTYKVFIITKTAEPSDHSSAGMNNTAYFIFNSIIFSPDSSIPFWSYSGYIPNATYAVDNPVGWVDISNFPSDWYTISGSNLLINNTTKILPPSVSTNNRKQPSFYGTYTLYGLTVEGGSSGGSTGGDSGGGGGTTTGSTDFAFKQTVTVSKASKLTVTAPIKCDSIMIMRQSGSLTPNTTLDCIVDLYYQMMNVTNYLQGIYSSGYGGRQITGAYGSSLFNVSGSGNNYTYTIGGRVDNPLGYAIPSSTSFYTEFDGIYDVYGIKGTGGTGIVLEGDAH